MKEVSNKTKEFNEINDHVMMIGSHISQMVTVINPKFDTYFDQQIKRAESVIALLKKQRDL